MPLRFVDTFCTGDVTRRLVCPRITGWAKGPVKVSNAKPTVFSATSLRSSRFWRAKSSAEIELTEIGTSCSFSSKRRAVTTIASPSPFASLADWASWANAAPLQNNAGALTLTSSNLAQIFGLTCFIELLPEKQCQHSFNRSREPCRIRLSYLETVSATTHKFLRQADKSR